MRCRTFLHCILGMLSLAALCACDTQIGTRLGLNEQVDVAILVPLGATEENQAQLGQSLANAAELANRDLADLKINLRVYPTAADQTTAATAAQTAIAEGADVILGPLFSDATAAVSPIARSAGVNVISFSNNPEIAGGNTYILGLTFDSIADRVTGFAAARGLKRIGIVRTEGIEGEAAREAILRASAKFGSEIVAEGVYQLSVEGISEAASGIADDLRRSGANVAILTDGPTGGLPFITETLRGLGVRPASVQFAGLQRWNSSQQALEQPGLQGGWFAAPDPALRSEFDTRYQSAFGQAPHPLSALAYDGMAAIGALVAEAREDRGGDPFSQPRLTKSAGFAGVNGVFRFLPDGSNERALAIFEVSLGTATPIDPSPRSFEPTGGS